MALAWMLYAGFSRLLCPIMSDKGSTGYSLLAPTIPFIWIIKSYEVLEIQYLIYGKWLTNCQDNCTHIGVRHFDMQRVTYSLGCRVLRIRATIYGCAGWVLHKGAQPSGWCGRKSSPCLAYQTMHPGSLTLQATWLRRQERVS